MSDRHHQTVLSWLVARAREVENEAAARGRPLPIGVAEGVAFMHGPDDADLKRLMDERMYSVDPDDVVRDLELRTDLHRLYRGWRPGPKDLANAPHLRLGGMIWTPFAKPFTVSVVGALLDEGGEFTGRQRVTSFLIVADALRGAWVRTWNRFYRLDHQTVVTEPSTDSDVV
jgi:hypothetical protein